MSEEQHIKLKWWIDTSRQWIVRAHGGSNSEMDTEDFGELLCYNIHEREMTFDQIAKEWNLSLEVLAELVADHIRRL